VILDGKVGKLQVPLEERGSPIDPSDVGRRRTDRPHDRLQVMPPTRMVNSDGRNLGELCLGLDFGDRLEGPEHLCKRPPGRHIGEVGY